MPAPSLIQIIAESDMTCNFKVKERNHHTNMITFKREFFTFKTLYYKFGFNLSKEKEEPSTSKIVNYEKFESSELVLRLPLYWL